MATIKDLFKQQNKDLYGLKGKLFIESRGLINAPRAAALIVSSPDALSDLIGNQIGGALGGSANRPTDTIFKNNTAFLNPPISLGKTRVGLQDAIDAGTKYLVKDKPAPASIFAKIKQGGSSPAGLATAAAASALNTFGSKKALNKLKDKLKGKRGEQDEYGTKWKMKEDGKRIVDDEVLFSNFAPTYLKEKNYYTKASEYSQNGIAETLRKNSRPSEGKSQLDLINYNILTVLKSDKELSKGTLDALIKTNEQIQTPYVLIKRYNKPNDNILLPGTISGITDESTPEWSNFKFIGSPFQQYRYQGVERSISFSLKMYYTDNDTKLSMQKSLDKLRTLVYPEEDISVITYPKNSDGTLSYSPLGFNGNFIYLTVNGLYNDLFGLVESLSIEIDDAGVWATTSDNFMDGSDVKPYPTVINVSLGFKIINNPKIENNKYVYNFTDSII
jgi:hypothetical protein